MKKISLNELFSGIGAQRKALLNLGFEVDVIGISEIDKYAIQSYEAIFGPTYNYGDICKAPRLKYADLWTYSFPCQDISVAGNQKGISADTRSGLLYQVQRLLEVAKEEGTLPKYLLLENVKNLVGKNFKSQFDEWIKYLNELGYDTYWQVLNAKNYGIPQNRERVFAISIRKDLNKTFEFPKPEELKIRFKDILEDEVDEKFYISQDKVNKFYETLDQRLVNSSQLEVQPCIVSKQGTCFEKETDIACTLMARDYKGFGNQGMDGIIEFPCIAASRGRNPENPSDRTVGAPTEQRLEINTQGTSNAITTVQKDNYVVEAKIKQVDGNLYPNSGNPQAGRVYKVDGISPALDTCQGGNRMPKIIEGIRIRKLTPLECWRLMGFDDKDFYKTQQSGVSNSQLYKQAGNSIVVDVLERIFECLF